MPKVKIISSLSEGFLSRAVNQFIENHCKEVVSVQYSTTVRNGNLTFSICLCYIEKTLDKS